jgi:ATP-dependent helicase/nuclease subunit A
MKKILAAKQIIREQRFNVELPADKFSTNPEITSKIKGESLAVQGVIDLVIIDAEGRIALIDYKTDRLTRAERENPRLASKRMNELHARQLSYYARAIESIFDKPCEEICIYSTHSGELYEVNIID